MPSITTREYNPTTGALLGNVSSLNFGKVASGSHTTVKVVDFAFTGMTSVSNIRLGIVSSTVDVNATPEDVQEDGSSSNGRFGVMHADTFDLELASGALGRHFAGLNESGMSSDEMNVAIGNRTPTISQFVYLDIELGANDLGPAAAAIKVFFDFE